MKRFLQRTTLHACFAGSVATASVTGFAAQMPPEGVDRPSDAQLQQMQSWIEEMKSRQRGPFKRLRWFCNDGAILPPKPYACSERGGGRQHGEYTTQTKQIRAMGFPIANFLVELEPEQFDESPESRELLNSLLVENFLIGYDNGWIFEKAQFYRGAIQTEDEERHGQRILNHLAGKDDWIESRFLLLREAVRLMPHNQDLLSLSDIRGMAATISDRDRGFRGLRAKIHGRPDAEDAVLVRNYAKAQGKPSLLNDYKTLANAIDEAYAANNITSLLARAAKQFPRGTTRNRLNELAIEAKRNSATEAQFRLAAEGMAAIRDHLISVKTPWRRVVLLDISLGMERAAFINSRTLLANRNTPRRVQLEWLALNAQTLYGSGLITKPEMNEQRFALRQINREPLRLIDYRRELTNAGRVSAWAVQRLEFHMGETIEHFAQLTPTAREYIPDRLRGSAMLFYFELLERLLADINKVAGIEHEMFGRPVNSGLRRLNPGLARGRLQIATHDTPLDAFDPKGIYLVPATLPELPPVAGILTRSEGNALSHIQLLARNLGIPNVVIGDHWLADIEKRHGEIIVVAASAGGEVRIVEDSFQWDNVFLTDEVGEKQPLIVNTDKLNLGETMLLPLRSLRAGDSGHVVGPKAAKLGELHHHFPGQVSAAIAIPFGIYNQLLNTPMHTAGPSLAEWLVVQYRYLDRIKSAGNAQLYQQQLSSTLSQVRQFFLDVPLPENFRQQLRQALKREFGPDGSYGVFVRSDTNVEDLEGFSGAGLNLTVHNVVGYTNIENAIRRVWASPFTERAFSWRQALMDKPEHVYASVLLHKSVYAEKSGVLVTTDLDGIENDALTVVINEGVGGGVDGQRAETLKILPSGTRRLSTANTRTRRVLNKEGGSSLVPVSGRPNILLPSEIQKLRQLAKDVSARIPEFIVRNDYIPQAADIEFGFENGKLWLFQIRPLVENRSANRSRYLNALDAGLREAANLLVDLDQVPQQTDLASEHHQTTPFEASDTTPNQPEPFNLPPRPSHLYQQRMDAAPQSYPRYPEQAPDEPAEATKQQSPTYPDYPEEPYEQDAESCCENLF